jgi:hypothetical protein
MRTATAEAQKLQNMTPQDYQKYRIEKIMGLVDAKDRLSFMLPKVTRQDVGGQILNIQDNPMLPNYGLPTGAIAKTKTFADINAEKNTGISAARLAFDKQEKAYERANPGYEVKETENGLVAINKKNPSDVKPVTINGQTIGGGKLNEAQGNATAYGMRMAEANKIIDEMSQKGVNRGANVESLPYVGTSVGKVLPSFLGGTSEDQQKVNQAKLNFITAVLRKESGANIPQSEIETEDKKYFPQFNDSEAVIKQKAKARELAIKAISFQAGPGAKHIEAQQSAGVVKFLGFEE